MIMSVSDMQERCKQRKTPTNVSVFLCLCLVTRTGIENPPVAICIFSANRENRITEPFTAYLGKRTFDIFLRFFVTIKNKQRTSLRRISAFNNNKRKPIDFSVNRCIIEVTR